MRQNQLEVCLEERPLAHQQRLLRPHLDLVTRVVSSQTHLAPPASANTALRFDINSYACNEQDVAPSFHYPSWCPSGWKPVWTEHPG